MRRDWDFVSMSDYQADMRESGERAAAVVTAMRQRAEAAERMLAEVVLAAGGYVKVGDDARGRRDGPALTVMRNEYHRCLEFEARRAGDGETAT